MQKGLRDMEAHDMTKTADECTGCGAPLTPAELEIGTGLCDTCGHATMAAEVTDAAEAAAAAQREARSRLDALARMADRLERERAQHAWQMQERLHSWLIVQLN